MKSTLTEGQYSDLTKGQNYYKEILIKSMSSDIVMQDLCKLLFLNVF